LTDLEEPTADSASGQAGRRLNVASAVALAVSIPFAAVPIMFVVKAIPTVTSYFAALGGDVPPSTQFLINASHGGWLFLGLVVIEVAIFVAAYLLARRYWIGMVFFAPLAYLALTATLYLVVAWPMFDVVSQVK
jgi:type II secretory pathway component PulF